MIRRLFYRMLNALLRHDLSLLDVLGIVVIGTVTSDVGKAFGFWLAVVTCLTLIFALVVLGRTLDHIFFRLYGAEIHDDALDRLNEVYGRVSLRKPPKGGQ